MQRLSELVDASNGESILKPDCLLGNLGGWSAMQNGVWVRTYDEQPGTWEAAEEIEEVQHQKDKDGDKSGH